MRRSRLAYMAVLTALLAITHAVTVLAGGDGDADIRDIVWKWQQTFYNNDTQAAPSNPSRYTVLLEPNGNLQVKIDCNVGGGQYTLEGSSISLKVTHTTMAACPPDSLEGEFLKGLAAAVIVFVSDGDLYLDLRYDTGSMKFTK